MLIAVSEISSDNTVSDVIVPLGDQIIFSCNASDAGVEWRCGKDRKLIFSSGRIYNSTFFIKIAEGWYNLTTKATSLDAIQCFCFDADDGTLIIEHKATVFAGMFTVQHIFIYVHVKYIYSHFFLEGGINSD